MAKAKNKMEIKDDIIYGDVVLDPDVYLDKKNHKIRINAFIDGDIYEELKRRSQNGEGKGRYQTLMNELLRQVVFSEAPSSEIVQLSKSDLRKVLRNQILELVGKGKVSAKAVSERSKRSGRSRQALTMKTAKK